MAVPPDELDRLSAYFSGRRPPRLPLQDVETKPDRAVLYRKMVSKEWQDAATPQATATEGECDFDFRIAFATYHTGQYARVWTSTALAKARGFENDAKGGSAYVVAQFVFDDELTNIFAGSIKPQKMKGAQHMNSEVLMHREGFRPYVHGTHQIMMFSSQLEVDVTIARDKEFDLGFTAEHAVRLNKHLKFARLRDN